MLTTYLSSNSLACATSCRYGGRATSDDGRRETRNCCSKAVVTGLHNVFLKLIAGEGGKATNRCTSRKSRTEATFFKRIGRSSAMEGRRESVCAEMPEESFADG
jgi:hypothetical protein